MDLTVVLPCYRGTIVEQFKQALESLLNQTVSSFAVLIVIDGPIDEKLRRSIESYSENHDNIEVLQSEVNLGLGQVLNFASSKLKTTYIARMDSDDLSVPDRFETSYQYLVENDLDLLGSFIVEPTASGNRYIRKVPLSKDSIIRRLNYRSPFNHVTIMKRSVLDLENYEHCLYAEDWYLWLRLLRNHPNLKVANLPIVTVEVNAAEYVRLQGLERLKHDFNYLYLFVSKGLISIDSFLLNIVGSFVARLVFKEKVGLFYRYFLRSRSD